MEWYEFQYHLMRPVSSTTILLLLWRRRRRRRRPMLLLLLLLILLHYHEPDPNDIGRLAHKRCCHEVDALTAQHIRGPNTMQVSPLAQPTLINEACTALINEANDATN